MVTWGAVICWLVMGVGIGLLTDLNWEMSMLFAALVVVTGPTVIVPLLRTVRPNQAVSNILRWEGILIDPLGALFAVFVFEIVVFGLGSHSMMILGNELLVGTVAGAVGALAVAQVLQRHLVPEYLQNFFVLGMVLFVFTISNYLGEEAGLIAVTLMGVWLANTRGINIEELLSFKENLSVIIISLLFILLAARIEFSDLGPLGEYAIPVLLVVLGTRFLVVWLSAWKSELTWQEKTFVSFVAPRGIVAAAVSSLFAIKLTEMNYEGAELLAPLTFMIILVTVLLQSILARPLAKLLHVAEEDPRGVYTLRNAEEKDEKRSERLTHEFRAARLFGSDITLEQLLLWLDEDVYLDRVEVLVIDEADRMLDMGFIPQVRRIVRMTPHKENRQTLMFSATFTPDVERLAEQWTVEPTRIEIEAERVAADSVDQRVYLVSSDDKFQLLEQVVDEEDVESVIVFANRRDEVRRLHEKLKKKGLSVGMLSGEVPQQKRVRTLDSFKAEPLRPGEERLRLELRRAQGEIEALQGEVETLKAENQNLRELARDFYAILENTADFVYVKDSDLKYTSASNALALATGHSHWSELIGKTDADLYPEETAKKYMSSEERVVKFGEELKDHEEACPLLHAGDGWVTSTKKRIFDSEGNVVGLIGISKDVTRRVQSRQQVEHMAHYDALTGLANRNLFDLYFHRTVTDSVVYDETYALIYIDLDNFKPVNDCYGHNVGDMVLVEIAKRIVTVVGQRGLVARLGGDEFAVKMKISSYYSEVERFVQHLIHSIGQPISVTETESVKLGCSVGITKFKGSEASAPELIQQADHLMYQAKADGKNQYRFHPSFGIG
eukprot:g16924.t1